MRSKIKKAKVGNIVRIVFLDHATGAGEQKGVITFECFGRILSEDKLHYNICHWGYLPEDTEAIDSNCEFHHIVKAAIVSLEILGK